MNKALLLCGTLLASLAVPATQAQNQSITNGQAQTRLVNVDVFAPPGANPECCAAFSGAGVLGSAGDQWNELGNMQNWETATNNLSDNEGNTTSVGINITGAAGYWGDTEGGDPTFDPATQGLMEDYLQAYGGTMTVQVTGLETNASYNLVVYFAGNEANQNAAMAGAITCQMGPCSRGPFTLGANYAQNTNAVSDANGNLTVTLSGPGYIAFNGLQVLGQIYGSIPPAPTPPLAFWLVITNIDSNGVFLNIYDATDMVYEVFSFTNVGSAGTKWNIEAELFPDTNTADTNYGIGSAVIPQNSRPNLFFVARDWTGVDVHSNGVPDWWEWKYFGVTDLPGTTNMDGDGNSLVHDYQNNKDPNIVAFTPVFPGTRMLSTNAGGSILVTAGQPFFSSVLVNSNKFSQAGWQSYSPNFSMNLTTNGIYSVSVGMKGRPGDATQTWMTNKVSLYAVPLALSLDSPANRTVGQSQVQLQGEANKNCTITFDVANSQGLATNLPATVVSSFFDPALNMYTSNTFQCGATLLLGANSITVHASDSAGEAQSLSASYTLDYGTNAPNLMILYPVGSQPISGGTVTLHAQVDDPTTTVSATANSTNTIGGATEPDGEVWIQNLPLSPGNNTVVLTAQNQGGNQTAATLNIIGGTEEFTIDPLPTNEIGQPFVTVTGTIGDTNDYVWINGVRATITGNTWEADNVPITAQGLASMSGVEANDTTSDSVAIVGQVTADPQGANVVGAQTSFVPQPASIVITSYVCDYDGYTYNIVGGGWFAGDITYFNDYSTMHWNYQTGGVWWCNEWGLDSDGQHDDWVSATIIGKGIGSLGFPPRYANTHWNITGTNSGLQLWSGASQAKTQMSILPSGQQQQGQTNLYCITASAWEFDSLEGPGSGGPEWFGVAYPGEGGDNPIPPGWMSIQGVPLTNNITTNSDGSIWGAAYITAPVG